ncbi:acetylxylan esterase [Sphingomonas sp. BAUL-RG-20F-R05-02]|uniref:acetylxylan esterase n=1 Tax=Sphingomonas sp. BAUL-RG-20F-R05-02 TaxID=2914830 RepID=UPI001F5933A4|nr:acetylxylan esterase [Sphingomonas sp. BAUL-RG-20F-R05-02]
MVSRQRESFRLPLLAAIAAAALCGGGAATAQTTTPDRLAPYFQPVTTGAKAPDADGFLQRWLLLEPIVKPNRSNSGFTGSYVRTALTTKYFPGQMTAVPRDGDTVTVATPLRWHALDAVPFDVKLFNFAQALGKPTYGVIFQAVTVITSPRERRNVRLAVGSNAASMWWLNGKEAVTLSGDRRMVMDDVLSPRITLNKGRNVLRGAVINGPGLSDFCVRFVDEDGKPIRDITVDVK